MDGITYSWQRDLASKLKPRVCSLFMCVFDKAKQILKLVQLAPEWYNRCSTRAVAWIGLKCQEFIWGKLQWFEVFEVCDPQSFYLRGNPEKFRPELEPNPDICDAGAMLAWAKLSLFLWECLILELRLNVLIFFFAIWGYVVKSISVN